MYESSSSSKKHKKHKKERYDRDSDRYDGKKAYFSVVLIFIIGVWYGTR